ncbi:MAG: hypothetical protein EXS37_17090 [Opitutus sp.]|nr:hypothetical protein [Opitutus sp.]
MVSEGPWFEEIRTRQERIFRDSEQYSPPTVETVGDEMRASIDGKPVGYLKSAGIGHPTKSKIELGVSGKDGYFEDIKVWNSAPAR